MTAAEDHERACRRIAARYHQRWLRLYVASKLRKDPAFPAAFDLFRDRTTPILDIGCGVGLLAAYLRERGCMQPVIGVDRDGRKIAIARELAGRAGYGGVEFHDGDVREALPPLNGDVVLFDVLHYMRADDQRELLHRVATQLETGSVVVIRDAPRDGSARFLMTYAAEKFAQIISWNVAMPLDFPTDDGVRAAFPAEHFETESRPSWGGTPFNNRLFTFRRR